MQRGAALTGDKQMNLWKLQHESMISAYRNRSKTLFAPNGEQYRGSTVACHFWAGFNGGKRPVYVRESDPCYKAGKWCAKGLENTHKK